MKPNFFVGYLPFPDGLKPFYRLLLPILLLAGFGAVYFFASDTPKTGTGTWDLNAKVTIEGRLELEPYPMIIPSDSTRQPVLVVQVGKLSARPLLEGNESKSMSLSGYMIERGHWQMLEIDNTDIPAPIAATSIRAETNGAEQLVSLTGEIVDSKCMLGVMKPGTGKVHRSCAELCIMGGMPPMLLVKNATGKKAAYLLVNEEGGAVGRALLPHVAVPVQVSGMAFRLHGMPAIKVNPSSVARLEGNRLAAFGDSIGLAGTSSFCRIVS